LDVVTYEQGLPDQVQHADGKRRGGEMCETITSHWGCAADDLSHKSPSALIERLAACRRHGANMLLNVGPEAGGRLGDYERACLALVGRWVRSCGEVLYAGEPSALRCRGRDFVLVHGKQYYYFCHNVAIRGNEHLQSGEPGDGLQTVSGSMPPVRRVAWIDNDEPLGFTQQGESLTIDATRWPYGTQGVVRVAVIETA
jgi:alpha-L-fucosidase